MFGFGNRIPLLHRITFLFVAEGSNFILNDNGLLKNTNDTCGNCLEEDELDAIGAYASLLPFGASIKSKKGVPLINSVSRMSLVF